jgi:Domain of unknown function (DUF4382)
MKYTKIILGTFFLLGTIAFYACKKDTAEGSSNLQIRMTDNPLALEEVNIDLKSVEVKFEKDSSSWAVLNTNAGVYNLLSFQNGVDTLIAQGSYTGGTIKEIRLIVGPNNTVKDAGVIYPLTMPSGSESGLKIKVNKSLRASIETLLIDFDAALSIKLESGGYKLRPVIKLK